MAAQAPEHLMGWAGPEIAEPAFERVSSQFAPFVVTGRKRATPGVPIWDYAQRINGGQHLPTVAQQVGDCVGAGAVQAGQYMSAFEIYLRREEELFKPWYLPFIYGMSRTAPDCGNGQLGRGDGSTGAWAAVAMMKHGILFSDDPDVPPYSGTVSRKWGYRPGPPDAFKRLASDNLVGSAARLRTVEEIREALCNYHMVTIASGRGFRMEPYEHKGRHVFKPSGGWSHQMSYIGWMDDPFPAAYRMNSWGANAHGTPLNGEPPGGAWNLAEDIEKELRQYSCEVYALSLFAGFPGPPDLSIV